MRDKELVMEVLHQIDNAAEKIVDRFKAINQAADFTDSPGSIKKGGKA